MIKKILRIAIFAAAFFVFVNAVVITPQDGKKGSIKFDFGNSVYAASSMNINFPQNTSNYQSRTITIPHLNSIQSMTVDTGSVTYSINGDNVTINVSNGNAVNWYSSSTYVYEALTNTTNSFPDTYYYNNNGYSGNLSKSGSAVPINHDEVSVPKTVSATHSNTQINYYHSNGTLYNTTYSWDNTNVHPSIPYSDGEGYSGTLYSTGATSSGPSGPTSIGNGNYTKTTVWTGNFSGTVKKVISPAYTDYTQYYSGTVYGSTTYYYAYNVTINYIDNLPPAISCIIPSANGIYGRSFAPAVSVSDPDGNTLTCRYYIDSDSVPKDTRTISNTSTAQNVSFNTLDINSLEEGTHALRFEVTDGIAQSVWHQVNITVDKHAPTLQNVAFTSTENTINISGSATDSTSGLSSAPYKFTIGSSVKNWSNSTSYSVLNLLPNTQYYVKFEAQDVCGNTSYVDRYIYTKASIPTVRINSSTESTLNISLLDGNPSATTLYQISTGVGYVSSTGDITQSSQWISIPGKSITIKGLAQNTSYNLTTRAMNMENSITEPCNIMVGTTLASPPSGVTFSNLSQKSITILWNSIQGATGYDIEVDGQIYDTGVMTSYTHSELVADTPHSYRIRIRNAGGTGNWSTYFNQSTYPNPPDATEITGAIPLQEQITITWNPAVRATSYEIEVDGNVVDNVASTTYVNTGLTPDTLHKYRIRAKNIGGMSDWSPYCLETTLPVPPPVPSNIQNKLTKNSVTLTWLPADRAEGYEVKADNVIKDNGNSTTFIDSGLIPLTDHEYRIRAKNRGGISDWSAPIKVTTYPPEPETPLNILATSEKDMITVAWYKVEHAESYDLEVDGSVVTGIIETSYVHTGLSPNTKHTYRLKAINISGESNWSNPVTTYTMSDTNGTNVSITNVIAVVTYKSVEISWDAVALNAEYSIEVDGKLIENGKNTVYSHTGLKPQTYHTYKIRLKNEQNTGAWCAVLSIATLPNPPDAPTGLNASATSNSIVLVWDKSDGATGYDIEIDGEVKGGGADSIYNDSNLTSGISHTYRVRAKNQTGVTAWSEAITKSTTNPTYTVDCKKGEKFDFSLIATNVQDFTGLKFVVTYNPDELDVTDLCGLTQPKDVMAQGEIPGTDLSVTCTPGRIEFTVDESIVPGTSWSGELNSILFKPKIDGKVNIDFKLE